MDFGTLRSRFRVRIGNPTTTDVSDVVLNQCINDAYMEIGDKYRFLRADGRDTFVTTPNVGIYIISAATQLVKKVWDRTNGVVLEKVGERYAAQTDYDSALTGKPMKYLRYEDYIQLFPTPDGVYTIEFMFKRQQITALAGDTDVPIFPLAWHRGILLLAAYYYYADIARDLAKAAATQNEYKVWLSDKPVEAHEEAAQLDSGVEVPTRSASDGPTSLDFDHSP